MKIPLLLPVAVTTGGLLLVLLVHWIDQRLDVLRGLATSFAVIFWAGTSLGLWMAWFILVV
jgi:hypothetical protein